MSKYFPLWAYIQKSGAPQLTLTFDEIGQIAGVLLDHSSLKFKKNFLTCYWVPRVQEVAAAHNIPFKVIHVTDKETAQNMPVPAQPMHCSGRGNF